MSLPPAQSVAPHANNHLANHRWWLMIGLIALALVGTNLWRHRPNPVVTIQPVPNPAIIPGTGIVSYEERADGAVRITAASRVSGGSDQNACFSPDGKQLLFTRFKRGYNRGPADLVLRTLATGQETVIVGDGEHDHVNVPGACWSSSTNRITFASDRESEFEEIFTATTDGTDITRVTTHRESRAYLEPVVSPDGKQIAFESDAQSEKEDRQLGRIRLVNTDGTELTALTPESTTFDDRLPNWSADGRLLFQRRSISLADEPWDVWVSSPDHPGGWTTPTNVSHLAGPTSNETDNSWFPNGQRIVSSSDVGGLTHPKIIAFSLNGSAPIPITATADREDGAPSVSPDGQWVAFESHRTADEQSPSDLWLIQVPDSLH